MDPVGPWSAYASYNRLAGVQAGTSGGDFHHHHGAGHAAAGGVPSTTSQLLLQAAHTTASLASSTASPFNPGSFLSPPPVAYDAVFSPLFHHANPKQAHYVNQHRQALQAAASKQSAGENEHYPGHHQPPPPPPPQGFFEQGNAGGAAWPQNSPFGILPHESVVPNSPGPAPTTKNTSSAYENFNAHFAAAQSLNHLNSQLAAVSAKTSRSQSPQVSAPSASSKATVTGGGSQPNSSFFQVPTTFGTTESLSTFTTTSKTQQQQTPQQQQQQDYNSSSTTTSKNNPSRTQSTPTVSAATIAPTPPPAMKLPEKKISGPGAGFMNSYLKFLQGERDSSPPPAGSRGGRKTTWQRKPTEPNGTTVPTTPVVLPPPPPPVPQPAVRLSSQGDPQDDPRYFPLPKERKHRLDSSSDGFDSSDDDLPGFRSSKQSHSSQSSQQSESSNQTTQHTTASRERTFNVLSSGKKGRPPKPGGPSEKKRAKHAASVEQAKNKNQAAATQQKNNSEAVVEDPLHLPPRRETSRRAAKEKSNIQQLIAKQAQGTTTEEPEDVEEPVEFVDSDSDPAWTPALKEDGEDDGTGVLSGKRKVKRQRPSTSRKRASRNLISAAAHGAGLEFDGYSSSDSAGVKKLRPATTTPAAVVTTNQTPIVNSGPKVALPKPVEVIANAVSTVNSTLNTTGTNSNDDMPFKPGEFVVIKSELSEEWPAIWRVDGKTLLQKYEPFDQNGQTLYRNISTYTSWTSDNKKLYIPVPVRFRAQNQLETIVEFLRSELTIVDTEFIERAMKEAEVYQDNFEVYIQTLISQALDSNFLTEIFQEQDDYFLSNVKTVDDITDDRKRKLLALTQWPCNVQASVSTWPCLNVISELTASETEGRSCAACQKPRVSLRILLYGQPYNATTLDGCQPDPRQQLEKDFLMCRICCDRVQLLNRVAHQKYRMYVECAKRVADKRSHDPHKDTTIILNELLADESWLSQLFQEVRCSWAEIQSLESQRLQSQSITTLPPAMNNTSSSVTPQAPILQQAA